MPDTPTMPEPITSHGPVTHGVECYEAWRDDADCPHEANDRRYERIGEDR